MDFILQAWDPGSARSVARKAGYCKACVGMLCTPEGLKSLGTLPGYRHSNMHQLLESIKQGCRLCEIILRSGWEHPRHKLGSGKQVQYSEKQKDRYVWFVSRGSRQSPPPGFTRYTTKDWEKRLRDSLGDRVWLDGGYVDHEKPPKAPKERWSWNSQISIAIMASFAKYFFNRTTHTNFLDGDIMQQAKIWLDDCVGECHERCLPPEKSQLPTRVLDVESSLGPIVRLQDQTAGRFERYAVLSYCWGGPQPLTATKSNIQTLISGVEIDRLPQTLKDAVYVTRRLGIRYLWIDALCIIQDSPEDKLSEIGKMGTVYRNAVVTIASAHARKASDGFLKIAKDNKPEHSCTMPIHLPKQPRVGRVTLAAEGIPADTHPLPLRTRGWAFQEAVLSRRILIFSDYDLHCHCKPQHEMLLNLGNLKREKSPRLFSFGTKLFDEFETYHRSRGDGWMSPVFLGGMWSGMLLEFTTRSLTVADDRLHAMQGIANELLQSKHLSTTMDRTYIAGTWMACLPLQLLWSRSQAGPSQPVTSRSKRAPTWSWGCLDCRINFYSYGISYVRPYKGFSLLHVSSEPDEVYLEAECDIVCRSLDQFRHDSSKGQGIRVTLDLDIDEFPTTATCVYYILLDKTIDITGRKKSDPLRLYYVEGIATYENEQGAFQRLGFFRWNVNQPAEDEYTFGQRRRVKLV
ncbi:hypothetical protein MRS44_004138 [Fusarium solani]|uniref:uncharacterized protein n=1 Tax=Fusarium solani TaxID=169388 RepID=UPI0032C4AB53|nr:hypothetical protein MRS44_004138 [Fusarium solani]